VSITVRASGEDATFRRGMTALSDHPAIYAVLRIVPR
jgi:hypothetical protein